jgi:hypothetical protein
MSTKFSGRRLALASLTAALVGTSTGCKEAPGTPGQQGAAIGGVSGAAAGALIGGEHHRLLGALIGGAVGAGGGYLIGANKDRITGHDQAGAQEAVRRAQENPATPQQAMGAATADLNGDGFVTMDEVVAMKQAGLSDQQMTEKLRATGQVFELSPQQQAYLRNNGVDQFVVDQMPQINREVREGLLGQTPSPTGPTTPQPTPKATPVPPPPSY